MDMLVDQGAETTSSASTSTSSVSRFGADTFMNTPDDVVMNDDLEPIPRDRCNTWPMRRPQLDPPVTSSPLIHEQIPEEDSDLFGSNEQCGRLGGASTNGSTAMLHSPDGNGCHPTSFSTDISDSPEDAASANAKKTTTRRNAWGNMSYAELITTAIMASPEKRLTLAQVYEWMVQNIPYFRDKGDSNSSAGWKNSIRHNLSLHSRFMRIQNEGAGKSSWWVINPEAKPGRNPRRTRERSNTIEATNKAQLEKTRRGAKKRIKERIGLMGSVHSGLNGSSQAGSLQSIQHDLFDEDSMQGSFDNMPSSFRPRTQSNLSVPGSSSRVSPSVGSDLFDDMEFPSWVADSVPTIPSDIVDRTDQIRLDAPTHVNGIQIKQESKPIKTEPIAPPPSYHELNSVRGPCAQNPLLRNPIVPSTNFKPFRMPLPGAYGGYQNGGSNNWLSSNTSSLPGIQSCGVVAAHHNVASSSALPIDLENLTLPDQPLMDMDVDALIRHELSHSGGQHINFDL